MDKSEAYKIVAGAIAQVCHEANRAYCLMFTDDGSQIPWEDLPPSKQASIVKGVEFLLSNPDVTPSDLHQSWVDDKIANGWKLGPKRDDGKKEHPDLVDFSKLPAAEQRKDILFEAITRALAPRNVQ